MKRQDWNDIKIKPLPELEKLLVDMREKLTNLKADLLKGKVKNVRELRLVKKNIARLLTLRNAQQASK